MYDFVLRRDSTDLSPILLTVPPIANPSVPALNFCLTECHVSPILNTLSSKLRALSRMPSKNRSDLRYPLDTNDCTTDDALLSAGTP
mmetsp:Transcript_6086/g.23050  ORF Transcript_6086/g.23050 Transcript_6086/m.23050 type:complete len:87 (+) Transcript_6086:958-1218(+)